MKRQTLESLIRYRDQGIPTGDFLRAVLLNDLFDAVSRGDEENLECLVEIVQWIYNELPGSAWRTKEKIEAWIERGGRNGIKATEGT